MAVACPPFSSSPKGFGLEQTSCRLGLALGLGMVAAALALPAGNAHALLFTGQDSYRNLRVSSAFGSGYEGKNLVDSDPSTAWVIAGAINANPQGRDEGWFSFELANYFVIDALLFAPRSASGTVDGVDTLEVWASLTPFNVDVTDALSTASFLASNAVPSFRASGFTSPSSQPYSYTPSSMVGRYVVGRLLNSSDSRSDRNLGAKLFQLGGYQIVPGPLPVLGVASAFLTARRLRRRCQLG